MISDEADACFLGLLLRDGETNNTALLVGRSQRKNILFRLQVIALDTLGIYRERCM